MINLKKIKFSSLVIIFGILVLISIFAFIFFRKGEYVEVVVKVGDPNYAYQVWRRNPNSGDIYTWFSQLIKTDMEEKDGLGRNVAFVTKIFRYDTSPDTANVYITVKIKTTYSRGSGQRTFKGKPVLVGSEIKLYLANLLINGTIVDIFDKKTEADFHKITVNASLFPDNEWMIKYPDTNGVQPYLAEAVKTGEIIYDSQDRPIIKVIDKKVSDAQTVVTTSDGRLFKQPNPLLKDVFFTLELLATKIGDKYYIMGNIPVVIGEFLPIHTKITSLYPTVTGFIKTE